MAVHMLNNGESIPYIGLGTFRLRSNIDKDLVYNVLDAAIDAGYRLIDTASCYRNEKDIGDALEKLYTKHRITRTDLFITSKLAPNDMGYLSTIDSCTQSLKDLKCGYLDCYLIHWPGASKLQPDSDQHSFFRKETWRAFQDLAKRGMVKSIGVSNFTIQHLEELLSYADVKPVLNQVEFHPHLHQIQLLNFCQLNGIFLQAYSSLGTGQLLDEPNIANMATEHNVSSAQILLKWALQQQVGVIPKSAKPEHVISNYKLGDFRLTEDDVMLVNSLNIDKHYCWDPYKIK